MKAVVAAFNQEKALVGAFSVLTNLQMELFQALVTPLMPLQKSDNEENLSIYRGPAAGGFSSSTLRVSRLRPEDLGAYTCTANNKLGRANHVITVCGDS